MSNFIYSLFIVLCCSHYLLESENFFVNSSQGSILYENCSPHGLSQCCMTVPLWRFTITYATFCQITSIFEGRLTIRSWIYFSCFRIWDFSVQVLVFPFGTR